MPEHVERLMLNIDLDRAEMRRNLHTFLAALLALPGVQQAVWDAERKCVDLRYDPRRAPLPQMHGMARDLGLEVLNTHRWSTLRFSGACALCDGRLEEALMGLPGVVQASVNVSSHLVTVEYEPDSDVTPARLAAFLQRHGLRAETENTFWRRVVETTTVWWQVPELVMVTFSLIFLLAGLGTEHFWHGPRLLAVGFYILSYLAGGYEGALTAFSALRQGILDIDFLMIVAALGAAYLGHWSEGATLLFLFSISAALEEFAMDRTRQAIEKLAALRPLQASVRRNGREIVVPVEEVAIGDLVIVRPGEALPVDGVVREGISDLDQSSITGESVPVTRRPGDKVFAGSLNGDGSLLVEATKRVEDSTLARIIQMVEEAQSGRAPTQRFIDRFSQPYATGVVAAVLLYLAGIVLLGQQPFHAAFYRAMTLLVVASPCALVISTPASFLSAIAAAAREGALFKGGVYLENLARVKVVAFDKTGTLTYGRPQVTTVLPADGIAAEELLRMAASAEQRSEHPLAQAIVRQAREDGLSLTEPTAFQALVGKGARSTVDGREVFIGNQRLMAENGWNVPSQLVTKAIQLRQRGESTVFVGTGEGVLGLVALADVVRPQAAETVRRLKQTGIQKVVMLTGDSEAVAHAIARQVGVDEVFAGLLPEEKVQRVRALEAETPIAMVGDGINDAPALALATVGLAMGAAGTDVAMETADVVLMADDLSKLPFVLDLSRKAQRIVRQNLIISVGVMLLLVVTTLRVGLALPIGVVGHEGSTLVVVLNGLRLLQRQTLPPMDRRDRLQTVSAAPAH